MDAAADHSGGRLLVGVSEAARILGVGKSQISRQVGKLFANHAGPGQAPLIDVDEARRARAEKLNVMKARNRGGLLGWEKNVAEAEQTGGFAAPRAAATQSVETPPIANALYKAQTADKALDAQLKRLRIARETGEIRDAADVEREQQTVARIARDRLLGLGNAIAAKIVLMAAGGAGEAEVARYIKSKVTTCLENLADDLDGMAEDGGDPAEDPEQPAAVAGNSAS